MVLRIRLNHIAKAVQPVRGRLSQKGGNILVYIVMVMVIFGLLGALMVSLFSTSISSSATRNDTRRAAYLSESGIRYAMSELRAADFSETAITSLNKNFKNDDYKISPTETFGLNIFSPWFEPTTAIDIGAGGNGTEVVQLPEGHLPSGFISAIPTASPLLTIVNDDYIDLLNATKPNPPGSARGSITSAAEVALNPERLQLDISDDGNSDGFVAGKNETLCFAVPPYSDQDISLPSGSLLLEHAAAGVFPALGGAFEINRHNYYYAQAIDKTTHVELTGVTAVSGETQNTINARTTDYVILSPRNRFIVSEGKSGAVAFGNSMDYAAGVSDTSILGPKSRKPDIEFDEEADLPGVLSQVEQNFGVINVYNDPGNKYISFSESSGSFGAVWFRDTRSIGGRRNFCQSGGCFFNIGFRAFFILNLSGTNGDGFTFSILNGSNNDIGSVGGDISLSELLAYAGDSRTTPNPTSAADFLDGRSGLGLQAPKLAVEFDGKANNQSQTICQNSTTVNQGSRFDPDFAGVDRDTVQHVFWGSNNDIINAPCRVNTFVTPNTNKTYDDNRHDSVNAIWPNPYDSGSVLLSSPAIDDSDPADVKIYTGRSTETTQNDGGRFIRLRPSDGTANSPGWTRNPDTTAGNDDDINSSPTLDSSGDIYIGNDSFLISKYNSSGSKLWSTTLDGNIEGKPFVSNIKNRVYVVTDNGTLYSLNTAGTIQWSFDIGSTAGDYTSSPAVRYDSGLDKNVIYVGALNSSLYVVRDDGATASLVREYTTPSEQIRSTPAINPSSGNVYFGSDDNKLYAVTPQGTGVWAFTTGGDVVSSPAVAPDGATVYVGSNDGHLYALNTLNGVKRWQYPASGTIGAVESSPAVYAADGTIYFGSNDGHLYALNPDGTLQWKFPTVGSIGPIKGKPARAANGIIYFGSEGKLYAIDPAANDPPNLTYPNFYLTPAQLDPAGSYTNNWLTDNPWAIRVEVERSLTPNGSGKYEYTLKTWLKKCTDADCLNLVGGFFQNTRFKYGFANESTPITPMTQTIELSSGFHTDFERFLFGFTSASTAAQTIEIRKFQLSFIRPNDPVEND